MEIVIDGWRSDTESWREAQSLPASELPPLSEEQKTVAEKLGIAEEAYARSAYAGRRTQDHLMEKAKRLAAILQQSLQARHPGATLNRIRLDTLEHRFRIGLTVEGRDLQFRMEENLIDDFLEGGSAGAGRQVEQILDTVLSGMAA